MCLAASSAVVTVKRTAMSRSTKLGNSLCYQYQQLLLSFSFHGNSTVMSRRNLLVTQPWGIYSCVMPPMNNAHPFPCWAEEISLSYFTLFPILFCHGCIDEVLLLVTQELTFCLLLWLHALVCNFGWWTCNLIIKITFFPSRWELF